MGSIGALGIGLSVVFSLFLVLLLAELYYLLFRKQSSRMNSVAPDRGIGSGGGAGEPAPPEGGDTGFLAKIIVGPDGECALAPPRLLFTIKEETREDLIESEDAKSRRRAPPAAAARPDHVALHVKSSPPRDLVYGRRRYADGEAPLLHVCSSSTSSDGSPPSTSSSSSCSSSSKGRAAAAPANDFAAAGTAAAAGSRTSTSSREEEEEEAPIENRSWASAQGTATEDEAFLTPPSSPGFSSPASSPAPMSRLPALRRPVAVRTQHHVGQLSPIGVQALRVLHVDGPVAGGARVSSSGSPTSSVADSPPLSPMPSSHRANDDDEVLLTRSVVLPSPSPSVSLASESWHN